MARIGVEPGALPDVHGRRVTKLVQGAIVHGLPPPGRGRAQGGRALGARLAQLLVPLVGLGESFRKHPGEGKEGPSGAASRTILTPLKYFTLRLATGQQSAAWPFMPNDPD